MTDGPPTRPVAAPPQPPASATDRHPRHDPGRSTTSSGTIPNGSGRSSTNGPARPRSCSPPASTALSLARIRPRVPQAPGAENCGSPPRRLLLPDPPRFPRWLHGRDHRRIGLPAALGVVWSSPVAAEARLRPQRGVLGIALIERLGREQRWGPPSATRPGCRRTWPPTSIMPTGPARRATSRPPPARAASWASRRRPRPMTSISGRPTACRGRGGTSPEYAPDGQRRRLGGDAHAFSAVPRSRWRVLCS